MKRRKDSGFTLIELMIVIAVIGILAIVLIPRVGVIKLQAKGSGVETNLRVVQGFCESRISGWNASKTIASVVQDQIVSGFSGENALVNPYSNAPDTTVDATKGDGTSIALAPVYVMTSTTGADAPAASLSKTNGAGTIVVAVTATDLNSPISKISFYAHDNNGKLIRQVDITP